MLVGLAPPSPPPSAGEPSSKKALPSVAGPEAGPGECPDESLPGSEDANAVLVFLPGIKEIVALQEALLMTREYAAEPARSWVLPVHSSVPPEEQRRAFLRAPPGVRKVVLATNIAETAITIDDVAFVVDSGRMKENRYDAGTRMESLDDVPISLANARQRRGRAGRCRPGVAFHLLTRRTLETGPTHQAPEVQRMPLDRLILSIKALKYPHTAAEVCSRLIEPPSPVAVQRAISDLIELDALTRARPQPGSAPGLDEEDEGEGEGGDEEDGSGEELTALGVHLSKMPVDVHIGKLILLGAIFGVTNDALTIAATLSTRSPFLSPMNKREEADEAKRHFGTNQSDHLTAVRAYNEWDSVPGPDKYEFCRERFLGFRTLLTIAGLKRQLLEILHDVGFVQTPARAGEAEGGRAGVVSRRDARDNHMRARAVEILGRQVDGSDGVKLALAGRLAEPWDLNPALAAAGGAGGLMPPPDAAPAPRRRAEGFGQCADCLCMGPGEYDPMTGDLYCHACWASFTGEGGGSFTGSSANGSSGDLQSLQPGGPMGGPMGVGPMGGGPMGVGPMGGGPMGGVPMGGGPMGGGPMGGPMGGHVGGGALGGPMAVPANAPGAREGPPATLGREVVEGPLLTSLLCAALYPQIIKVRPGTAAVVCAHAE